MCRVMRFYCQWTHSVTFLFFFFPLRVQAKFSVKDSDVTAKTSLWLTCNTTTSNLGTNETCSKIEKIQIGKDTFKTESTAEKDAAIAGLVLAILFSLLSFVSICCTHKCSAATSLFLALLFTAITVGVYVRYKSHALSSNHEYTFGFFIAAAALASAFFALLGSCCIRKSLPDYEYLA